MNQSVNVGGQAVLEGVMMRAPNSLAIAVRRPDTRIVLKEAVWQSVWNRFRFFRWPFLRGTVVMIEAMVNGMQALNFSAREAMPEEQKSGASTEESSWQMAFPMLLSVLFAIALFKFVPHMAATYAGTLLTGTEWNVDNLGYHIVNVIEREPEHPLSTEARLILQEKALATWIENARAASTIEILVP